MLNKFKNYFRDIFINSIAASNITPQFLRKYMYTLYGMTVALAFMALAINDMR